jgi:hypothetical protein
MPALTLTMLFVSQPPRSAEGQPRIELQEQDTARKAVSRDSIDLAQELDSNRRILTEIQGNVQGIKKGVTELVKENRNGRRRLETLSVKADTIKDTVVVTYPPVKVPVPYEVIDSAMIGKNWFQQLGVHVSRCRIKYIFRPKMWGKGKF